MLDLPTILFILPTLIGVSVFWRGWRGRRIDNHPWCRKCRFDLHGLWPGAARCPECGIDLDHSIRATLLVAQGVRSSSWR